MADPAPLPGPLTSVRVGSASDQGRVRSGNEDRVHVDPARGIFIVADGVGGHAAGEVAAAIAVEVIPQRLARPSPDRAQAMREAIALANNEIHAQAASQLEYAGMTCVLTAAHLADGRLTVGHVGDTRLYRIDAGGIRKITHDHSPIGEREDGGELSETDAMRHPRRNEVFRDVGSGYHEPDDPDFVEVFEGPFDERSALLICSDGLSDMVTSVAIERIVRLHAGDPSRVAESLVLAANDAGGRDNVSVVYVEGEQFAAASGLAGTTPRAEGAALTAAPALNAGAAPAVAAAPRSRAGTWLVTGLVGGLAAGLGLAWMVALDDPVAMAGPRVLEVSRNAIGGGAVSDAPIGDALAGARAGDTVRIGPGEYAESVVLPDGIHLEARDPGSVTLLAPPARPDAVVLTVTGGVGSRVAGLRIAGTTVAPAAAGVRIAGGGVVLEDITIDGMLGVGIDLLAGVTAEVRASRLSGIQGVALRAAAGARPSVVRSVFVQGAGGTGRAFEISTDATATFDDNVFVGFPELARADAAARRQLLPRNLVLPAPAAPRRNGR